MKKYLTVQDMIDRLQKVEDKSAIVVSMDMEYGEYIPVTEIYEYSIPESMNMSDDFDDTIKHINCISI